MVMEHVEEQLGAYALGCLEVHEAEPVAAHLAHCAQCRASLAAYVAVAERLCFAAPVSVPLPGRREALLVRVRAACSDTDP